jgi:hypothetical protein
MKSLLRGSMRMRGLEPPRAFAHTDLNRARLPIPPHPRGLAIVPAAAQRLLATGAVVIPLLEHRQACEVPFHALREVVAVRLSLSVDERERLLAPGPLPARARVASDLGRDSRPLHAREEDEGASE